VFFPASDEARRANLPPPQFQLQGQNIALPADATLASTSALTMQTLQHLVPTLHLLKYANAAIMRLQSSASASEEKKAASDTQPSVHARATKWWAEEAREGQILRDDADLRKILKAAGLGVDPEVKEGDAVVEPEGPLLVSAKMAVAFLQEQGAKPSEMWKQ
jgi:hypothetical protein